MSSAPSTSDEFPKLPPELTKFRPRAAIVLGSGLGGLADACRTHFAIPYEEVPGLPVSKVPEFLDAATARVRQMIPGCRPVPFGHIGDGNIHFNISQPVGADREAFLAHWEDVNHEVHAIVRGLGGSISAEHGIGTLKRDELAATKQPVEIAMMRGVKALLDPNGIMNPGKVL